MDNGSHLLRKPAVGCWVTTVSFEDTTVSSYGGANGGGAWKNSKIFVIFAYQDDSINQWM